MEEIYNRWIETGQINENDVIPVMIEYIEKVKQQKITPEQCIAVLQICPIPVGVFINNILILLGKHLGYEWIEVYNANGAFLRRFWNRNETSN